MKLHNKRCLDVTVGLCASILTAVFVFSVPSGALAQADDEVVSDSKTPPAQMAGTWTGSIDDVTNGAGTLTLDLTQIKSTVGGTFSADWASQANPSGTVNGHAKGEKVKLVLTATNQNHACKVRLSGKVLSLDEYTGSYKSIINSRHCKAQGTFDVFLQP